MHSQAIGSPLASPLVLLVNALWLSKMAIADPSTSTSTDRTRSVTSSRSTTARATVTVEADNSTKKGLSLAVIIVIVVAVFGEFEQFSLMQCLPARGYIGN
jgi:hypothetical protein